MFSPLLFYKHISELIYSTYTLLVSAPQDLSPKEKGNPEESPLSTTPDEYKVSIHTLLMHMCCTRQMYTSLHFCLVFSIISAMRKIHSESMSNFRKSSLHLVCMMSSVLNEKHFVNFLFLSRSSNEIPAKKKGYVLSISEVRNTKHSKSELSWVFPWFLCLVSNSLIGINYENPF